MMDIFSETKYRAFNFISLSQTHKNFKSVFGSYWLFLLLNLTFLLAEGFHELFAFDLRTNQGRKAGQG